MARTKYHLGITRLPWFQGVLQKICEHYGVIVAQLTAMLRKNSFVWTQGSLAAFEALKLAMPKSQF